MQPSLAERANQQMVDRLIAQGALWSHALIAAFRQTPRHRFLSRVFQYHRKSDRWREVNTRDPSAGHLRLLYSDRALITHLSDGARPEPPVPISSSSQPSLMAQMLEDLRLGSDLRTLEIGTGTGYNAALLAHVVGPGQVYSIDVDRAVLAEARAHLEAFADRGIALHHADGRHGFPDAAPFDRIMVTAATFDIEPAWMEQLSAQGLLLAPLALAPGLAFVVRGGVTDGVFQGRLTRAAYFMPLRAEGEAGPAPGDGPIPPGPLQSLPAPWTKWFDRRRPRNGWLGFIQALAFFGWLRGLGVSYMTLSDGQPAFGLSDPARTCGCWLGLQYWQVSGETGRELAATLWRAFLDAGGPWPTEFLLRASPRGHPELGDGRQAYHRLGPRCHQVWELIEPRDRPAMG
jgi:protein-L-isoaspartate(D-aspartate) O-methyltransferase